MDHWSENLQVWGVCFCWRSYFWRFLFEWIVTWYQRNHRKDIMFSHTRKYSYHSMRCFWCFQRINYQHQIFESRWRCISKFFHTFLWVLGYLRCPFYRKIVGLDVRLPERLPYSSAGYAVLPTLWNLWRIGDERVEFPTFQVCCYEKSWTLCLLGGVTRWGHEEIKISWNTGSMNNEHWCNWCFFQNCWWQHVVHHPQ